MNPLLNITMSLYFEVANTEGIIGHAEIRENNIENLERLTSLCLDETIERHKSNIASSLDIPKENVSLVSKCRFIHKTQAYEHCDGVCLPADPVSPLVYLSGILYFRLTPPNGKGNEVYTTLETTSIPLESLKNLNSTAFIEEQKVGAAKSLGIPPKNIELISKEEFDLATKKDTTGAPLS